jgi:hypothetical protein
MKRLSFAMRATRSRCAIVLMFAAGCGSLSKPTQSADDVVREFRRALSDGQASAAYALMSPEYRQQVSLASWQKNFDANPQEVGEAENRLAHDHAPAELHAIVRRSDGAALELVQHAGRWYVASEEIEFYDQSTPRAALRSFIAALTRKRYDVVLRLMPDADKETVTNESMETSFGHVARDEVERLLSQLRAHVEDPIESTGERATMPYAEHKRVQFVRQAGRWRVEDPE